MPIPQGVLDRETTKRVAYLWGRPYTITPQLIDEIFGDGEILIGISPIMHRPNYWIARVDSKWNLDNFGDGELFIDHLDDVLSAAAGQFGDADDCGCEDKSDDGHWCDGCYFPAVSSDGCSWFEIKEKD
jgi:hypothetical protein